MQLQQKKIGFRTGLLLLTLCFLLSGCSIPGGNSYVSITSHDETYHVLEKSNMITVNSQLSLKAAILNFIMEGTEEAELRVESFTDNMPRAFSEVAYEVAQQNPIGAYAVDTLLYEYTRIVGYYELSIHVTYRHSPEELQKIVYLSDTDSVKAEILRAMTEYEPLLVLNIGNYTGVDPRELAEKIFRSHSELALSCPEVTFSEYPKSGTQRILEICFSYPDDQEECRSRMAELSEKTAAVQKRVSSVEDPYSVARRIFNITCRAAEEVQENRDEYPYADSMYGVLVDKTGTSYGFARTYQKLLIDSGIVCALVQGKRYGYQITWCRVQIGSDIFYVDPGTAAQTNDMTDFMIEPLQLIELGYNIGA